MEYVNADFTDYDAFKTALTALKASRFKQYQALGPTNLAELEDLMPAKGSHVRFWTTFGAISGLIAFFGLCIITALIFGLIVGGKPPVSNVPYMVVGYEGTILTGGVVAMLAVLAYAGLRPRETPDWYEPNLSADTYGIRVAFESRDKQRLIDLLTQAGAAEIHEAG